MEAIKHIAASGEPKKYFMDNENFFSRVIFPALCMLVTGLSEPFWWILAILFLMTCDFFLRVLTLKNGEFSSGKMWKSVNKFGKGIIFILVAFFLQKAIVPDLPLVKIIGGLMIASELKSIDEKAKEIYGFSLFDFVIDRLIRRKNSNGSNNS